MASVISQNTNSSSRRRHKRDLWHVAYRSIERDPDGKKLLTKLDKVVREGMQKTGAPIGNLNSSRGKEGLLKFINTKAEQKGKQSETGKKITGVLIQAKDLVGAGVAVSPPATIAVAGLFMALSLQQKYYQQVESMVECTGMLARIVCRKALASGEVNSNSSEDEALRRVRDRLRDSYIDLYDKILRVTAKLVCKLDSKVEGFFDNLVGKTDWPSQVQSLRTLETECDRNIEQIHLYKSDPSKQPSPYSCKGQNLLHSSAKHGSHERVSKYVEEKAFDINAKDGRGNTALSLAAQHGELKCLNILLDVIAVDKNSRNQDQRTALHLAAAKDHAVIVQRLLYDGADRKITDKDGCTALHLAADSGRINVIRTLCRAKTIELNTTNNEGRTALHLATLKKHVAVVKVLLDKKAMVDTRDGRQRTPFLDAAEVNSTEILSALQNAGADIHQTTRNNKWTALHICASAGSFKSLSAILSFPNINVNLRNAQGRTALHLAVWKGKFLPVKALCEKGAEIDTRDETKRTPFLNAAKAGYLLVVKRLKESGAAIDQVSGRSGWSALHEATATNKPAVIKYLIEAGINKEIKISGGTKKGMTAKVLAENLGHTELIPLL